MAPDHHGDARCAQIVELMEELDVDGNGTIEFDSQDGEGTCVHIELPWSSRR